MRTCNLSLVICTRNRAERLRPCLDSIVAGDMRAVGGELVLVDNASSDGTWDEVQRWRRTAPFPVQVVQEPRVGHSAAANAGIRASSGDIVIFTDDDCRLTSGYLPKARDGFAGNRFDYCGGQIWLPDDRCGRATFNDDPEPRSYPPYSFIPAGAVQGANMLFHRRVVEAVGFFDERLGVGTPFIAGDIDYVARASWKGFRGAHVPELIVYHHHERDPAQARRLIALYDRGRGAYYVKFACQGKGVYLKEWWKTYWRNRRTMGAYKAREKLLRELAGGGRYLWSVACRA